MNAIEQTLFQYASVLDEFVVVKIGSSGYSVFGLYIFALGDNSGLLLKYRTGDEHVTIESLTRPDALEIWNTGFGHALRDIANESGGVRSNDASCAFVRVYRGSEFEEYTIFPGADYEKPALVSLEQTLALFEILAERADGRIVIDRSMPTGVEADRTLDELKRNTFAEVDRVLHGQPRAENGEALR